MEGSSSIVNFSTCHLCGLTALLTWSHNGCTSYPCPPPKWPIPFFPQHPTVTSMLLYCLSHSPVGQTNKQTLSEPQINSREGKILNWHAGVGSTFAQGTPAVVCHLRFVTCQSKGDKNGHRFMFDRSLIITIRHTFWVPLCWNLSLFGTGSHYSVYIFYIYIYIQV